MPSRRPCFAWLVACAIALAAPAAAAEKVDFKGDVYPILSARCFGRRQGADAKAGYRLDLRAELLGETNGRPLVRAGDAGNSRLIELVSGAARGKVMPPRGERLTDAQVAVLRAWVDEGLAWDDAMLPP